MKDITTRLKERFCKDCNIPIRVFKEPYFTDRLELLDPFYGTLHKWEVFKKEMKGYNCEQDYFEEYNSVKDRAINKIKESEAYQRFNAEDMNKFGVAYKDLPNKDIFKESNNGRRFVSVDMKKANFSSLRYYDKDMFMTPNGEAKTWEDFIKQFTNNEHIINSKYIRQVILGNCNPKKHVTYEKYIMGKILEILLVKQFSIDEVVFFSNDEIVFDVTDRKSLKGAEYGVTDIIRVKEILDMKYVVPVRAELFTLHKIEGTNGYYKKIVPINTSSNTEGSDNKGFKIDFKCLDSYYLPFVMRKVQGQEVTDSDKVFYHEGLLATFIEEPDVNIDKFI